MKNEETGQWGKAALFQRGGYVPLRPWGKIRVFNRAVYAAENLGAMAIRWHMGGFDDTAKSGGYAISNAFDKYPIAVKLHLADLESTYLREKGTSAVNKNK